MSTDVVVVYSPVGGGHKAAAVATAEAARARGLRVELVDAFEHAPRWAGDAYVKAHLTGQNAAPDLYGRLYFTANRHDATWDPIRHGIDRVVFGGLGRYVEELAPRVVVATHHLPLVVLGRERRKGRLGAPVVGVVTDYIAHRCWVERGVDMWTVPCASARRELVDHGVALERIALTGIPVRKSLESIPAVGEPQRLVRVLVTSGGFGVGPIARIVRSFAGVPNVALTIVCGAAKSTKARVEREVRHLGLRARVIGFESDMPARIAEAHVVVGKAGGLTVSETMTAGRPMIIASAVPGNEKVNEELVVHAGAGIAAEPDAVGAAIEEMRARRAFVEMGRRARGLVCMGAADRVVDVALDVASHARVSRAA